MNERAAGGGGSAAKPSADVIVDAGCGALAAVIARALGAHRVATADLETLSDGDLVSAVVDSSAIVLGARGTSGSPASLLVRRARARLPHVSILLCVAADPENNREITEYARAGADAVYDLSASGCDVTGYDLDPFLAAVQSHARSPAPEPELRLVLEALPQSEVATVAMYCLRNGHLQLGVSAVARAFGLSTRTLGRWLRRQGLPRCGVLLRAGWHFQVLESGRRHPGWSREKLARSFGYQTAAALRLDRWRLYRSLGRDGDFACLLRRLLGAMR